MSEREGTVHVSDLVIGKMLLGQIADAEAGAVEAHAEACGRCRATLDEARAMRARFGQHVYPRTLPTIERRVGSWRRSWRWLGGLTVATGLAGAVALAVISLHVQLPGDEAAVQVKGSGALKVFGRRGERVFLVENEATLRPGDQIRFSVEPGASRFVLIASIDGRRQANLYYPSAPVVLDGGLAAFLPDSIVLDDAPGPERIFALFSDRPLEEEEVTRALRAAASGGDDAIRRMEKLPLPYPQASLLFEKSPRSTP